MVVDKNLYGCWEVVEIRYLNSDGGWEKETVVGGVSMFTASGVVNTFSRTDEVSFGYSGNFILEDNVMIVDVKACSIPEMEGRRMQRSVNKLTSEQLVLGMLDEATGRPYEIEFRLLTNSFKQ